MTPLVTFSLSVTHALSSRDKKFLGNTLNFHKSRLCSIFKIYRFGVQEGPPQETRVLQRGARISVLG